MPDNPYMVGDPSSGGGPSYSRPLLNWQGMAQGIGDAWSQRPQQASTNAQPGQPGQAAGPMNIRPPAQMQGMPLQGQPTNNVNGPSGWGQRLQDWLNQRGLPGSPSFSQTSAYPMGVAAIGRGAFGINPNDRVRQGFDAINERGGYPPTPTDPRGPQGLY
jgi:hypothetical protein